MRPHQSAPPLILRHTDKTGHFNLLSRNNGPIAPPRDWDALKRAYEAPGADPIQVAATNNIALTTLQRYVRDRAWSRNSTAPSSPGDGRATGPPVRVSVRPGALIRRLRTTVILKLEQLEMDILASGALSPTDHERHSRAIGTLVKAAEIVDDNSRAEPGTGPHAGRGATGKPFGAPETAGNDEDRVRRELAARIKRLRERLSR